MINTGYATLNQRPEPLYAVGVDVPTSIFPIVMANSKVDETKPRHSIIAGELIGVEDCPSVNLSGYVGDKSMPLYIGDDACHHLPVPLCNTDDFAFAFSTTPTLALLFATDIGFISLNLTSKSGKTLLKKLSYLPEHAPSRLVGDTRFPLDLLGGYSAPCGRHLVDCLKPSPKRRSRLVEDSASNGVDLMPTVIALIAWATSDLVVLSHLLAIKAVNAIRVTMVFNPLKASIVIGELIIKVFNSVFSHFLIPFLHVLYHNLYMLSRDNYLINIKQALIYGG
jgi:hypothetical protein